MEPAIQVENLSFSYNVTKVIHNATFVVPRNGISALIGPNGSGKSTILKLILGLYTQQAGTIIASPDPKKERDSISYSPEVYSLLKDCTVLEYLMLAAQLRGIKIRESRNTSKEYLARIGLDGLKNSPIHTLSKGNSQKIQLVACLISKPKLTLLDEPWSGLDPENQEKTAALLTEAAYNGTTVLITGHHMGMIERACTHVVAIRNGSVIVAGSPPELLNKLLPNKNLHLTYATTVKSKPQRLEGLPVTWDPTALKATVNIKAGLDIGQVISTASKYGHIIDINTSTGTLHDAYMELYADKAYENA